MKRPGIAPGVVLGLMIAMVSAQAQESPAPAGVVGSRGEAVGVVFHDRDGDGVREAGEEGLPGVRVSDGRRVVRTDAEGRYRLPLDAEAILFVIKPRGWMTPVDPQKLPRFYYIHKPAGSPKLRHPGSAATGPTPETIDFPLHPQEEPDRFRVLLFGDTQPQNQKEIDYVAHDVVESLVGATDASFGVTLGDIVGNNPSLFGSLNRTVGSIGIPWYNVLGNHDLNFDSPDDEHSDESFEAVYGPPYYSFDRGPVHFLVLDDVVWHGGPKPTEKKERYTAGLGPKQLEFIRNDLAMVPEDQLIVLMMHIPLNTVEDRSVLFRLIEGRPHALSISAHTHVMEHRFLGAKDGWEGAEPHHHFNSATVSGSWWSGAPDEAGIPHTTMRDGAPNGYSILTFDGHQYEIEFRAARRPADHQMAIHAPEEVEAKDAAATTVLVNVFAGSARSTVRMRLGGEGEWIPMKQTYREDPAYAAMKRLEGGLNPPVGPKLPEIRKTSHMWEANLPADPPAGTHLIHIRATDMFGRVYTERRVVRIR